MRDLKYLASYIIPCLTLIGLKLGGGYTYAGVVFAFVVIPLLEPLFNRSEVNLTESEVSSKLSNKFFDLLLYLNLPLIAVILWVFAEFLGSQTLSAFEIIGAVLSVGTVLGANGINVAHELGHRFNKFENVLAQGLLLPSFYMHFFIEHNYGHHRNVATPEDPATARFNEPVYVFWLRSAAMSYADAWKIETQRLKREKKAFFSFGNKMLWFLALQCLYIAVLLVLTTPFIALMLVLAGVMGFLLLETINYIEHYGLVRNKLKNGRYERVRPRHSWNSNHELGRIVLYELTRHSDHHFISSKKYQVLNHHDQSPQLPLGYPTSMLLSLVPPLWFRIMNPKVASLTPPSH